ncbi:kelch repeat-containing protein [Prosthecobacter sp.]|uniref:Kelch repeat-containing protein n=1 Tax=Prosthecobacter sp. TaxID=1965333 RepID=UPI0025D8E00E|nr:kelch repeat-containing protein [Prosthecobacter sp.]
MLSTAHAEWEALPSMPEPNGGFMCGVSNGKIVVVGGTNWEGGKKNWLKAIHAYDLATKAWTKVTELENPVAYGAGMQIGDGFVYLGGSDGKQPVKELSTIRLSELPASTVLTAGGAVGSRYVIAGGTDDALNVAGVQSATHMVEWVSGNWEVSKVADYPGKPFAVAASAVVGDELFVFGGMNYDHAAQQIMNTIESYAFSPAKNVWRKLKPLAVARRGMAAVALDESLIYIAGGFAEEFTTDAFIYDVRRDSYKPAKPLPYAAMVALVKLDGFVYCLGGEDKKQSRTDKFFRIPVAELLK